jgi:hypothetical protein
MEHPTVKFASYNGLQYFTKVKMGYPVQISIHMKTSQDISGARLREVHESG